MRFRLAQPEDDVQLRQLLRETVIPGHIRMTYAREPNFFAGFAGGGKSTQVLVLEDKGRIAGVGCRSIRNFYINGKPQYFGYLSGLRLLPEVRNKTALARGYAFLRELHTDNRCPAYLTTIIDGNDAAESTLTSRRAGLPAYTAAGGYLTRVYPVRRSQKRPVPESQFTIQSGDNVEEAELREFLSREGARRQFFPACGDSETGVDLLAEIGRANLVVVMRGKEIAGIMGLWDRNAVRQYIVAGYSPWLGVCRPFLNLALRSRGFHGLPSSGEQQRIAFVALPCIKDDDPQVFRCLFRAVCEKAGANGIQQLVAGMHEDDPLNAPAREAPHITYRSRLYLVSWDDVPLTEKAFDDKRVPYLEAGML